MFFLWITLLQKIFIHSMYWRFIMSTKLVRSAFTHCFIWTKNTLVTENSPMKCCLNIFSGVFTSALMLSSSLFTTEKCIYSMYHRFHIQQKQLTQNEFQWKYLRITICWRYFCYTPCTTKEYTRLSFLRVVHMTVKESQRMYIKTLSKQQLLGCLEVGNISLLLAFVYPWNTNTE